MKTTNDIIDGVPVIEKLSVDELGTGKHRFFFKATTDSLGNYHRVPVIVIKGSEPGKKLFIQSTLHGDEVQGVDVIHQLLPHLDPATLKGTVVMVPGANLRVCSWPPAIILPRTRRRRLRTSTG